MLRLCPVHKTVMSLNLSGQPICAVPAYLPDHLPGPVKEESEQTE